MSDDIRPELAAVQARLSRTLDDVRKDAAAKRHAMGYRTARENLADLVDADSFTEYGQLGIAAQRNRRDYEDLQTSTAADGVITGVATINRDQFGEDKSRAAVVVYDYSVLAGTQGYYHHKKLDRIFELAEEWKLPVIMYTEGGGGRPGDTDVTTQIAGLNIKSFSTWARMSGLVPRIAINNGYCFAGNAARGMSLVALHNGGGTGIGKAVNGGYGLVLDGSKRVDDIIQSSVLWDVMGGVARRNWARNPNAMAVAMAYNQENANGDQITIPFLSDEGQITKTVDAFFSGKDQ